MRVLGVDPGVSGAMVVLEGGKVVSVQDMPTVETRVGKKLQRHVSAPLLADMIRCVLPLGMCVFEDVRSSPQMGVTSAFNFGASKGVLTGVLAGLRVPSTAVAPTRWILELGLVRQGKDAHRARAAELFPDCADVLARKCDDGRADAMLLAHWWERHG